MKILLLNSTYEPLEFISEKKAIKLIIFNKVEPISYWEVGIRYYQGFCFVCGAKSSYKTCSKHCNENLILTPNLYFLPSIIRLKKYIPLNKRGKRYGRNLIFKRDDFICQYCNKKLKPKKLTIDHVLPRSMGGKTNWENCVTSCIACNQYKADRTPKQANLELKNKPKRPNSPIWDEYQSIDQKHSDWAHYIIPFRY